jgi:hypothetical protein
MSFDVGKQLDMVGFHVGAPVPCSKVGPADGHEIIAEASPCSGISAGAPC